MITAEKARELTDNVIDQLVKQREVAVRRMLEDEIAPKIEEAIKQGEGMVPIPSKDFSGVFFKSLVADDLRSFGFDVRDTEDGDLEIRW